MVCPINVWFINAWFINVWLIKHHLNIAGIFKQTAAKANQWDMLKYMVLALTPSSAGLVKGRSLSPSTDTTPAASCPISFLQAISAKLL